jgi:hypothetical protein
VSLIHSFGQRACAVDMAPLLRAPLFMLDGIQGRGLPLILCTRWPHAEPCLTLADHRGRPERLITNH